MQKRRLFEWGGGGGREARNSLVDPDLTIDEKLRPVDERSSTVPVSTSWVPKSEIRTIKNGGATIVQGAIVQGDSCPRRQLSKGQFSKETFVQGDFSPRRPLSKKTLIQGGL